MKSTGIVRKVDDLGRLCIPAELRRTLNIEEGDTLEIFIEGEEMVLRKYQAGCIFCGEFKDITSFKNKIVCKKCIKELK